MRKLVPRRARATALLALAALIGGASPADKAVPETFRLEVGGRRVAWHDGKLEVREIGGFGPKQGQVLASETLVPTPAQWAEFWKALEECGVWNWKPDYRDPRSARMDGVRWSLEIAHAGRGMTSNGYNAFPERWSDFESAVWKLTANP